MKKAVSIILLFCSMVCLILAGCSDGKDTYTVKQVLIDINGNSILLDINDKTLSDYQGVAKGIDSIGDKIIIKDLYNMLISFLLYKDIAIKSI